MAYYKVNNTGLSNELLTLWLKARDGLSCEEARELIDKVSELESEVAAGEELIGTMYTQEDMDAATEDEAAYAEGEKAGKIAGYKRACDEYAVCLDRLINPAWGKKPTKERIIIELGAIIGQMRADDGSN